MDWQAVIDLGSASLDQVSAQLRELQAPADLIEQMNTALVAHFAAGPIPVSVRISSTALSEVRNFFVVETNAAGQPRLELYLY